jgi:hypothetical protein
MAGALLEWKGEALHSRLLLPARKAQKHKNVLTKVLPVP